MGLLFHLSVHSSIITLVMALYRHLLSMFLIILSTNVFLTKAEKTKDQEEEREEKWNPDNIMEKAMDRFSLNSVCTIPIFFTFVFCPSFKRVIESLNESSNESIYQNFTNDFCDTMKSIKKQYCKM